MADNDRRPMTADTTRIMFPGHANLEYRWTFADGTVSGWRLVSNGIQEAPPQAIGLQWREAFLRRAPEPSTLLRIL